MEEIKYSFIIPIFNTKIQYLRHCLENVVQQKGNYEVLLIDDGSTEAEVKQVCEEYLNERVKYYYKENGGVSSARNYGVSLSVGRYIIFIDADDSVLPSLLEELEEYDGDTGYDMLIFNHFLINEKDKIIKKRKNGKFNMGVVWGKVFKRSRIVENSVLFPEHIRYAEDSLFLEKLLPFCGKQIYVNKNLYGYRINESSVGHRYNEKNADYFNDTLCAFYEAGMNRQDVHRYAVIFFVDYVLPTTVYHKEAPLSRKEKKRSALELLRNQKYVYGSALENLSTADISLYLKILCRMLKKNQFKSALILSRIRKKLSSSE